MSRFRHGLLLLCFLVAGTSAYGSTVRVPKLEILTRGWYDGGSILLRSRTELELEVDGGYKFGGFARVGVETDNFEGVESDDETLPDPDTDRLLFLISAGVIARDLFETPWSLTYFLGELDEIATGDEFVTYFGTRPFSTDLRGNLYFPRGPAGGPYDGIHAISGTGVRLSSEHAFDRAVFLAYTYQDDTMKPGVYSSDLRTLLHFTSFRLEPFAGSSFPHGEYGLYRGGLLLHFDTGTNGEFFSQIGVTYWEPPARLELEDLYLLFEPRLYFDPFSFIVTFFLHPQYYLNEPLEQEGAMDINFQFALGKRSERPYQGGLDNRFALRPEENDQVTYTVSPFFRVQTAGVRWDLRFNTRVYPFNQEESFEVLLGLRTEF